MNVHKKEVIRLLETIALYMEIKGENPFKVNAFRKAASALETDERSLTEISDFTAIPGIGKSTAAIITEFIETGSSSVLNELKRDVPETLLALLKLPGLGGGSALPARSAPSLSTTCLPGIVSCAFKLS